MGIETSCSGGFITVFDQLPGDMPTTRKLAEAEQEENQDENWNPETLKCHHLLLQVSENYKKLIVEAMKEAS